MSREPTTRGELFDSRLAENLRKLIEHQSAGSVNGWCERHKLPQSTINKLRNGTRDATVSVLETIEEATGYAPWQLLHPEFDPALMPPMMDARAMRVAAIFSDLRDEKDRRAIENSMEWYATAQQR